MPRVPTYDNFQVSPTNLPNAQVRPVGARFDAPFTEGMATAPGRALQQFGQGLAQAGAGVNKIVQEEFEVANQVRVNDAVSQAAKARLELTFNPTDGFANIKGENALKRPGDKSLDQEFSEKLQTRMDGIAKGLGNDQQRMRFKAQADQLMLQFQGSLNQHMAKEFNVYQDSVDDGTVRTGQEQMALAWGDPNAIKQAQDAVRAAVVNKATRYGISGKAAEAALTEALSPGHSAVIAAAVDAGSLDYARQYLKDNTAELSPQARLQLTKAVDVGDFEKRTQDAAGDLWTTHKGDIKAALSAAREKFTGKDEDAIVTRLKTLDGEKEAITKRQQAQAQDTAWDIFNRTGSLAKIPATIQASMDPQHWAALRNTAKAAADGGQVKTDPNIYYALTLASATDSNFKGEDLRKYADKLSPTDFKHFVDLQGKANKPGEIDQVASVTQQKDAVVKALELKGPDVGVFHQVADKALFAAQTEKGRALDQGERQKILDRLVLEGTTPGSWFGSSSTRAFKAQADGKPFTPVFNDSQKRQATAALQRQGVKNPTSQQVEAVLRATYNTQ
jgi:hypothetical protein